MRLKLKTEIDYCSIGVIRDEMHTLMKDGASLINGGNLYLGGFGNVRCHYVNTFTEKDTIITMTLNKDQNTIAYKINGKQCDTKAISLSIDRYRLVVSLERSNDEIELL